MDRILNKPYKITLKRQDWPGDDQSGPPMQTIECEQWFDADGTTITDRVRIAELEAAVAARSAQHDEGS
jgi:hypothetical protein